MLPDTTDVRHLLHEHYFTGGTRLHLSSSRFQNQNQNENQHKGQIRNKFEVAKLYFKLGSYLQNSVLRSVQFSIYTSCPIHHACRVES